MSKINLKTLIKINNKIKIRIHYLGAKIFNQIFNLKALNQNKKILILDFLKEIFFNKNKKTIKKMSLLKI